MPPRSSSTPIVPLPFDSEFLELPVALRSADTESLGGFVHLEQTLRRASLDFIARRDDGQTVIAGYPWFLDWGRDTLIAARGLLAGGWHQEVVGILDVFGRFAERGTLPNSIHGDNASNRDTSDAPLWYAVVAEETVTQIGPDLARRQLPGTSRSLVDTVRLLVEGYLAGTPNGIRVDPDSALVWSPSHFTWMDTNHPACTPREGYPVEIRAVDSGPAFPLPRRRLPNRPLVTAGRPSDPLRRR